MWVNEEIETVHGFVIGLAVEPLGREGNGGLSLVELDARRNGPEARAVPRGVRVEPLTGKEVAKVD